MPETFQEKVDYLFGCIEQDCVEYDEDLRTLERFLNSHRFKALLEHHAYVKERQNTEELNIARTAIVQSILRYEPTAWKNVAYAKLGAIRDGMKPEDVEVVQNFLGPLEQPKPKKEVLCPDCGGPLLKPGYVHICPKIFPRE